jgi:hypothetical protein
MKEANGKIQIVYSKNARVTGRMICKVEDLQGIC